MGLSPEMLAIITKVSPAVAAAIETNGEGFFIHDDTFIAIMDSCMSEATEAQARRIGELEAGLREIATPLLLPADTKEPSDDR